MQWFNVVQGPVSLAAAVLIFLSLLLLLLRATVKLEGYDFINEMIQRDNAALGLRFASFLLAVVLALLGIFDHDQSASDIVSLIEHTVLATLLIYFSRHLNDWLILYEFRHNREVVDEKNIAVALVESATYLASAYVIAGAFNDWESGLGLAVVWFIVGQLLLVVLAAIYRRFASGVGAALDQHNIACAVSFGSFLLSGGMMCGAVITGPSHGWQQDLSTVAVYTLVWLGFMIAAHWLSDRIVLRTSRLSDEVMEQGNLAVALFKAVIFLSITLAYTHG